MIISDVCYLLVVVVVFFCACENVIGCCTKLNWSCGNGVHAYKTSLLFAMRPGLIQELASVT